jgi:hypothetical protein
VNSEGHCIGESNVEDVITIPLPPTQSMTPPPPQLVCLSASLVSQHLSALCTHIAVLCEKKLCESEGVRGKGVSDDARQSYEMCCMHVGLASEEGKPGKEERGRETSLRPHTPVAQGLIRQ